MLFPPCGIRPIPLAKIDAMSSKYTRKKLTFTKSEISNMKAKVIASGKVSTYYLSKVQLVLGIIWKALIGVDRATHTYPRESILIHDIYLLGKMVSSIPEDSCRNIYGLCAMNSGIVKTTEELVYIVSDSITRTTHNYSKDFDDDVEGKRSGRVIYLEVKDVPYFEDAIDVNNFSA
ncbi:transferase, chloramphenicol acetyltransferase-like domain protein [Tanacetum coccineum]